MRHDHYPRGTVQALLLTDKVTAPTRVALQKRLDRAETTVPQFFDAAAFVTLRAVCQRLIPQPEPARRVDLAGCLDDTLAAGNGNGWRYDKLPADGPAFKMGLTGVNETALAQFGRRFYLLSAQEQDEVLRFIQAGIATGPTWQVIPAALFFEELLAALVELYYSHPYAQEEIGEVAMAEAQGWQKIKLNEREAWEPEKLGKEEYGQP